MKRTVLVVGLLLIVLANFIMVYYAPYGVSFESFQNNTGVNSSANSTNASTNSTNSTNATATENSANSGMNSNNSYSVGTPVTEGFSSGLHNAGGAKDGYQPMGQFDGVKLSTGNTVSQWRYTAPNEPLTGAEFVPGDDALFMFKNNQCKPECCGASFSCGGGCVCTTPQQRQYIAGRGGNRTEPEDGV